MKKATGHFYSFSHGTSYLSERCVHFKIRIGWVYEALHTEHIELFIEDQAFLWSYDSAPRPPPPPLSHLQLVSLCQSSCVSPIELTDRRRGWARSQIIRQRGSLTLYKILNTIDFIYPCALNVVVSTIFLTGRSMRNPRESLHARPWKRIWPPPPRNTRGSLAESTLSLLDGCFS
jgi:hypothetical protein